MEKTPLGSMAPAASALGLLLGAVAYHLWRVATLRADFERLGDTRMALATFGGLAFAASVLRWSLPGEKGLVIAMTIGALNLLLYAALFERADRSSSLVFAVWMASAVVDLAVTALWLTGIDATDFQLRAAAAATELALIAGAVWRFFRCPSSVRARGYRRLFNQQ